MAHRHIALLTLVALAAAYIGAAGAATPEADFAARCAAPGVLKCVGFDTQLDVNRGKTATAGPADDVPSPNAVPNNIINGSYYPGWDTTGPKASGAGALRLSTNPNAANGAQQSGFWKFGTDGNEAWGQSFGANTDFWVQYRTYFSPEYAAVNWAVAGGAGSGGNKNSVIYAIKSCGDLEISTQDIYARGYFANYANCGGQNMYQRPVGVAGSSCLSYNTGYFAQFAQGRPFDNHMYTYGPNLADFWCVRDRETDSLCPFVVNRSGAWWTFTYHVTVKAPGVLGSRVETWVSRGNGEPNRKMTDFTFPWNYASGNSFRNIMLSLYMTDKRATASNPLTHVWYDELIISTQQIAFPGAVASGPQDTVPPAPPSGLFVQ